MDLYDSALMLAPALTPGYCVVCGYPYPTAHHVVKRSHGGQTGPTVHLCGSGTTGCHGKAEARTLHLRYEGRWEWMATAQAVKYQDALDLPGWRRCVDHELTEC